jgi:hypothetical protein
MTTRERPIIFSAAMVRAILDGTKSQTRRIVKPQGDRIWPHVFPSGASGWMTDAAHAHGDTTALFCPYGQPGDRLWLREKHSIENRYRNVWCTYAADGHRQAVPAPQLVTVSRPGMRPSIHMPRWASRITLEVTGIRAERLQDISFSDVKAEGCEIRQFWIFGADDARRLEVARTVYKQLWESINGPDSWDANPWVWVVRFRRAR